MRLSVSSTWLIFAWLAAAAPARAEDFTGVYAGVNAGYAFRRDNHIAVPPARATHPSAADDALPPSARDAASLMQERRNRPRHETPTVR